MLEHQKIFCPYRVCPLGAHVDHQLGLVTGFALDKGISLEYVPTEDGRVHAKSKNFEVHNSSQPINSFCLLVPKNKLDPSLVEYVRKTRANRQKKLLAEIEAANQKMQKQNEQKIICEAAEKFEELTKNSRS